MEEGGGREDRFIHSPPPPPPPLIPFFCSRPNFLDELARNRLLRRLGPRSFYDQPGALFLQSTDN